MEYQVRAKDFKDRLEDLVDRLAGVREAAAGMLCDVEDYIRGGFVVDYGVEDRIDFEERVLGGLEEIDNFNSEDWLERLYSLMDDFYRRL